MCRRRSACATVLVLLALVGAGWLPVPLVAHTAPPIDVGAGAVVPFAPAFRVDGAHLAPGVTLRLAAVGRGDALTPVNAVRPTDDGTQVIYAHGNATEWYLRVGQAGQAGQEGEQGAGVGTGADMGIEQGVTFAASPPGLGDAPLALTVATPGAAVLINDAGDAATLVPFGTGTGTGVNANGGGPWQYNGLHVTDATGRTLPARLAAVPEGIRITVDDAGAVYPVTVDPYAQRQVLYLPGTAQGFGAPLMLSADGGTLVVNASAGPQSQGAVQVFARTGAGLFGTTPVATLLDPGPNSGWGLDGFGSTLTVSSDGGTVVIGAPGTGSGMSIGAGVIYLYARVGAVGTGYSAPLTRTESLPSAFDAFGSAVAISGDGTTLVVGSPGSTSTQGVTYIFTRMGSSGLFVNLPVTLTDPPTTAGNDHFGRNVGTTDDGNTVAIAAGGHGAPQGVVCVYFRIGSNYSMTPVTTLAVNGSVLALSGDGSTLVVGLNAAAPSGGVVNIYARVSSSGGVFTPKAAILTDPGASANDNFGTAVAVNTDGSTVIVGAVGSIHAQGAVYQYSRVGGAIFGGPVTLTDPLATNNDGFGGGVALSGDTNTLVASVTNVSTLYVFGIPAALTAQPGTALAQSATVTTAFAAPSFVLVKDSGSNPLSGVGVTFAVAFAGGPGAPGGSFAGSTHATVFSDANGIVTVPIFTASTTAGTYPVVASTNGIILPFTFTNTPGPFANLIARPGTTPQNALVNTAYGTALAVTATDIYDNAITTGVSVTFSAPPTGATGSFATNVNVVTNASGIATATVFTADTLAGNYSVSASTPSPGVNTATSFSLTNTPGVATSVTALSGGNASAQLLQPFAAPLRAQVRDAYGNAVGGVSVTFTAPTALNVPTATFLNSGVAVADLAGVASLTPTASGRPGSFDALASIAGGGHTNFPLTDTATSSTVLVTGFSPASGPTTGGTVVTIHGVNFGGASSVTFDTTFGVALTVVNGTTITVTAPAHAAAGTVTITVNTNGEIATIYGYTYLPPTGVSVQPSLHPPAGNGGSGGGGGGIAPMVQPGRR